MNLDLDKLEREALAMLQTLSTTKGPKRSRDRVDLLLRESLFQIYGLQNVVTLDTTEGVVTDKPKLTLVECGK